jgi:hypothetical protein
MSKQRIGVVNCLPCAIMRFDVLGKSYSPLCSMLSAFLDKTPACARGMLQNTAIKNKYTILFIMNLL